MYSETRPWGTFFILDEGAGFKVKRIAVNPGGRLSLQSHKHRGEHWTVVTGIATVTVGDTVQDLSRAQHIDIPQGREAPAGKPHGRPGGNHRGAVRRLSRRGRHHPL